MTGFINKYVVLLISQKDYEHYTAEGFNSKLFLSKKIHVIRYGRGGGGGKSADGHVSTET